MKELSDLMSAGGPAFPTTRRSAAEDEVEFYSPGMTLRDYFAAAVLSGIYANSKWNEVSFAVIAADAYEQAEAMLADRKKSDAMIADGKKL